MTAARSSRRAFLAGAAAGVATVPAIASRAQAALPETAPGAPAAAPAPVARGCAIAVAPRGGPRVVAHQRRRTIGIVGSGRSQVVGVGGQPVDVAVSPDGRLAAVTTGFWDEPGLALVDMHDGSLLSRIDVGDAPCCVAFTARGKRLLVTGGEQSGRVYVVDVARRAVVAQAPLGKVPRGVAATPDGRAAWVALMGEDQVVRVDTRTGRITRTLRAGDLPDRVAVSPDGQRLLVTHGGRDVDHVSEIAVSSRRLTRRTVGRLPSGVGHTRAGRGVVALGGAGEVVILAGQGRRTARRKVGGAPRGLAVAGGRAWVADDLTDAVRRVKL